MRNWIYYGIFLTEDSKKKLLDAVRRWFIENNQRFPEDWRIICEYMTLVYNDGSASRQMLANEYKPFLNQEETLDCISIGVSTRAIAVEIDFPTQNRRSHVTVAVAPGARTVESNAIETWFEFKKMSLKGTYKRITQ